MPKTVLLINPWIYDFSAYDLWMKPVGLLKIASHLRKQGMGVNFFDCLGAINKKNEFNCGKFDKQIVKKPEQIKDVPRIFYRYGVPVQKFTDYLNKIPHVDIVYVGSGMTYWYIGVQEVIKLIRQRFGSVKIILGGIYASLCRDHALKYSGADEIWNNGRVNEVPAWDLMESNESVVVQTSFGCPYNCSYCGTHLICKEFYQRPYKEIAEEIEYCINRYHPKDIAFYDDAFLVNSENHTKPLLEEIMRRKIKVRFHTPNALHARFVDEETARLMKKTGFTTIRLGFETSKKGRQDNKVNNEEFMRAVSNLKDAGFTPEQIGAYTMFGSMDDTPEDAVEDIKFVTEKAKVQVKISSYALVPGSGDYKRWGFDDALDPLWHNKTIFPTLNKKYTIEIIRKLRRFASEKNRELLN